MVRLSAEAGEDHVHDRALAWFRRRRYLDEPPAEDRSNEPAPDTPIHAIARLAPAGGTFAEVEPA